MLSKGVFSPGEHWSLTKHKGKINSIFSPETLEAYICRWSARFVVSCFMAYVLKKRRTELFLQKLFMWRKMKVSASYCSLFLFLGIKTSSEALRQFVSWSELVNSLSFSGAGAVVISWGFLMLKKLPFITARGVSKAVSLCNVQFACSCVWQLLPSPARYSF